MIKTQNEPQPYVITEFDSKRAVMEFGRCMRGGPAGLEELKEYFQPRVIWEAFVGEDAVGNECWQPSTSPIHYRKKEQDLRMWEEISCVASAIVKALRKENEKHLGK